MKVPTVIVLILSTLSQLATRCTGQYLGSGAMGAALAGSRGPSGYGGTEAVGMGWAGSYSPSYTPGASAYGVGTAYGNVPGYGYRPGLTYNPLVDPSMGSVAPYSSYPQGFGASMPIYPSGGMTSAFGVGGMQGGISPISYSPPLSPGFSDVGALAYGSASAVPYAPTTFSAPSPIPVIAPQQTQLNENENANTNININHDMGMHHPSLLGKGLLGLPRM
ncbi:myelin-associated neurite-outgrowth inhibitor-like [Chelonus insularis]|uniref:myelin-associated neurite-outgrowth inhibitor-like n=1 Tax=Chelonus insularis TaxID=460826 RepID=UPI001588DD40|nr:myelin-associated neurite-outgrowth inhibitor-like [Chelonus insularis]